MVSDLGQRQVWGRGDEMSAGVDGVRMYLGGEEEEEGGGAGGEEEERGGGDQMKRKLVCLV